MFSGISPKEKKRKCFLSRACLFLRNRYSEQRGASLCRNRTAASALCGRSLSIVGIEKAFCRVPCRSKEGEPVPSSGVAKRSPGLRWMLGNYPFSAGIRRKQGLSILFWGMRGSFDQTEIKVWRDICGLQGPVSCPGYQICNRNFFVRVKRTGLRYFPFSWVLWR